MGFIIDKRRKVGVKTCQKRKRVVTKPASVKGKKRTKIAKSQPQPPKQQFSSFLNQERNLIIEKQHQVQKSTLELQAIDKALTDQTCNITTRNKLKAKRLDVLTQLKKSKSVTVSEFDKRVSPFARSAHKQDESVDKKLTELYYDIFPSKLNTPMLKCIDIDLCPHCNVPYLQSTEESMLVCPDCSESKPFMDTSAATVAYGDEVEFTSFSYKRINHLNEWLNHFQAKEATPVPNAALEKNNGIFL